MSFFLNKQKILSFRLQSHWSSLTEKAFPSIILKIKEGLLPENVTVKIVTEPYPTVAGGIIDQFRKSNYNMVVIGRKRMSKAEEFVLRRYKY